MTKALKRDLFRKHRTSLLRGFCFTAQLSTLPKVQNFLALLTSSIDLIDEFDMLDAL